MQKCKIWTDHSWKFPVHAGQQNSKFGVKENGDDRKDKIKRKWSQKYVQWTDQGELRKRKKGFWA